MMQPPMRRNPMQANRMPMPGPPRPKGMQSYAANGKPPTAGIGDPDDDGDMDAPPAAAPPPTPGQGGSVLTLDQMGYHEDPHACSLCKHYDQGGNCEVAQQQVNPDGGCLVFSAQDDDSGGDMSGGQPPMPPAPGGAGMYGGS